MTQPTPSPSTIDAAAERGEERREAWEKQFPQDITKTIAGLLVDYLYDNFRELYTWTYALRGYIEVCLASHGTDDELATLGEVFGEAVSWETFRKAAPVDPRDPFHSAQE